MHLLAANLQTTRLQCVRTLRWNYMRIWRFLTLQNIHYASVRNASRRTRYCEILAKQVNPLCARKGEFLIANLTKYATVLPYTKH
jgi:hypothetical protein